MTDELPGGFDMVLECDINVYNAALYRKLHGALEPGGRLVIVDQLAPAEGVAPPSRVHWAFEASLANPDHAYPTAAGIRALLGDTGFQLLSEGPLPPVPGASRRFTEGMVVMEARR